MKNKTINIIILIIISIICIQNLYTYYINEKMQKDHCIAHLSNYDEYDKGCEKYFFKEKFYKSYMKDIYKIYNLKK